MVNFINNTFFNNGFKKGGKMKNLIILSLLLIGAQTLAQEIETETQTLAPLPNSQNIKTEEIANNTSNPRSQNAKNSMQNFFKDSSNNYTTQKSYQQKESSRRDEQINKQKNYTKQNYSSTKPQTNHFNDNDKY